MHAKDKEREWVTITNLLLVSIHSPCMCFAFILELALVHWVCSALQYGERVKGRLWP